MIEPRRRPPYWLLLGASALWLGLVWLAPLARARDWAAAGYLYLFFDPICHQLTERSFHAFGEPLAVCQRCTGLYAGFLAGLLALPWLTPLRQLLLATPRWVVAFALPMLVDVAWPGGTPLSRFATGFLASFPVALLAWAAAEQLFPSPRKDLHGTHHAL